MHVEPEEDLGAHIEDLPEEEKKAAKEKAEKAKEAGDRVTNPPPNFRPTRKVREGESRACGRIYLPAGRRQSELGCRSGVSRTELAEHAR